MIRLQLKQKKNFLVKVTPIVWFNPSIDSAKDKLKKQTFVTDSML